MTHVKWYTIDEATQYERLKKIKKKLVAFISHSTEHKKVWVLGKKKNASIVLVSPPK